jgi:hypothetical protein
MSATILGYSWLYYCPRCEVQMPRTISLKEQKAAKIFLVHTWRGSAEEADKAETIERIENDTNELMLMGCEKIFSTSLL